jgi:hypothetical protein
VQTIAVHRQHLRPLGQQHYCWEATSLWQAVTCSISKPEGCARTVIILFIVCTSTVFSKHHTKRSKPSEHRHAHGLPRQVVLYFDYLKFSKRAMRATGLQQSAGEATQQQAAAAAPSFSKSCMLLGGCAMSHKSTTTKRLICLHLPLILYHGSAS